MEHHHYSDMGYAHQHDPHWMERSSYGSQHHSPMDEYPHYDYVSSPPMQPGFATTSMHPTRPALQPIVTTPWPSMLASGQQQQQQHHHHQQQHHSHNVYTPHAAPVHSMSQPHQPSPLQTSPPSATPHLGSSHPPHTGTAPRKTLTDNDRRKMCQYHEDHPTKKQTEIGEIFGVERSTVSKVLRQKEKYLHAAPDIPHSPAKSSKKNKPDLDRALAKWATNQTSKGVRITDELIRNQAHFFWQAAGNSSDLPDKINSPSWLEKFKQKNGLNSAGSGGARGASPVEGEVATFSPGEETPVSPEETLSRNVSPTALDQHHPLRRQPSNYDGLGIRGTHTTLRAPLHSQSNTSLSSAFTDQTGAAFSSEDTSVASPVISPDALHSSSSYFPPAQTPLAPTPVRGIPSGANDIRPRSSTFPTTGIDAYISPPQSANTTSPLQTATAAVFDSPQDMPPPPPPGHQVPPGHHKLPNTPATHSPLSPHSSHASTLRGLSKTKSTPHLSVSSSAGRGVSGSGVGVPSLGDAKRGLEVAVGYLKSQGLGNDSADVAALRSVMMKMQVGVVSSVSPVGRIGVELPGGLHRIPEMEMHGEGEDSEMGGLEDEVR